MINARFLLLTGIACLMAVAMSAPTTKHSAKSPFDSCKKAEHKEEFKDDDDFITVPKNGRFVYQRFGIGYFNLAQLDMDEHFGKHMIPAPKDDKDDHGVAAIGGMTLPDGRAVGHTIAHLAVRGGSKVHAFKVKKMKFFCLQNNKPAPCIMGFKYSPATYETQGTVEWHDVGSGPDTISYASSWGSPPSVVVFKKMPKLQAFSFGLPIPKLGTWNSTTPITDKLDGELNKNGTTAYLESIEIDTWECDGELPRKPLGGIMKVIATGNDLTYHI